MTIRLILLLAYLCIALGWKINRNGATGSVLKSAMSSGLLAAGLLGAGNPALADGFGINQVKETVRPFNEMPPAAQRRFAVGLCKDGSALKKAGFASYPECTKAVFEEDYGIVTGDGAEDRITKRKAAEAEGKSVAPSKTMSFDFSGGSKDASSQALKPGAAKAKKGLQPKQLTAYQLKEKAKTDQFKNDPLFQKLNSNSKVEVLPIMKE